MSEPLTIESLVQGWQGTNTIQCAKQSLQSVQEMPNALVLGISLQPLPLKDFAAWIQSASEEEIKGHKGMRCSFVLADLLFPGFTSIQQANGEKGTVKGKPAERLGIFDSEDTKRNIIFFTYKGEQNKKTNTYLKTKRFDDCTSITRGMVVSGSMWANKVQSMMAKGGCDADIGVFDLCLLQLGIKSITSNASESGMMLEIKNVTPLPRATARLSMCGLLPLLDWMPKSVQESGEHRARFVQGDFVEREDLKRFLKQDLVKNNYSSTMHLVALRPEPGHGVVGLGADGKLKFFQEQPMGDVSATTIELTFDASLHHPNPTAEGECEEWMARLLNVAVLMGALELFVIIDEYRMRKNSEGGAARDVHLQGYARINVKHVLSKLVSGAGLVPLTDSDDQELVSYIVAQGMPTKHLSHLQLHGPQSTTLQLVIDTRKMTKTAKPSLSGPPPMLSSLVHPECAWSKGHMLHIFNEKKCVLSLVLALSGGSMALHSLDGGAKRVLEPVKMAQCTDVEYEAEQEPSKDEPQPSHDEPAPAQKPLKKKAKPSPAAGEGL